MLDRLREEIGEDPPEQVVGADEDAVGSDRLDVAAVGWTEPRSSVDLEVPIRAAADADPGEYAYAVTPWGDPDRDDAESVTKEHTITITITE